MRAFIRYAQAPSTSARRAWALPVLVMPPRRMVSPAGLLARDQAEIGHQLARVCKACEIAHFSDQHHDCDRSDTPHRLPNWAQIHSGSRPDICSSTQKAPLHVHDGIDVVLKCDLLRWMFEGQS